MIVIKKDAPIDMDEIAFKQLQDFLAKGEDFWQVEAFFTKESYAIKGKELTPSGYTGVYSFGSRVWKLVITQNG